MKKIIFVLALIYLPLIQAQSNDECLMCHDDPDFKAKIGTKTVLLYVSQKTFSSSVHGDLECTDCHTNINAEDIPHRKEYTKVNCGECHDDVQKLYVECLHGKAKAKGDPLAPLCQDCHGNHNILPVKDHNSAVAPMKIPFLCGSCHREGTPVQLQRNIPQDRILENYSESIHGEGLLVKGLLFQPPVYHVILHIEFYLTLILALRFRDKILPALALFVMQKSKRFTEK